MTADVAQNGLGLSVAKASSIIGLYTAINYMGSIFGGWITDNYLGTVSYTHLTLPTIA